MALTMTRTRTQTTLTKLAMLVANVHGELEFVEGLLGSELQADLQVRARAEVAADGGLAAALERRRQELLAKRQALYETLRQFDPGLDPAEIGVASQWQKAYGRIWGKAARRRYFDSFALSFCKPATAHLVCVTAS